MKPVKTAVKTDAQKAEDFRNLARPLLEQLCTIQGKARVEGMRIEFVIGVDAYGRDVANLAVVKVFSGAL